MRRMYRRLDPRQSTVATVARSLQLSLAGSLLWAMPLAPQAQVADSITVAYHQGKAPVALDAVGVLGPDLFGDRINLFNGSFAFEQTDVQLPGNNALPVAIVRPFVPRQWFVRGALADWDLNTPCIEGGLGVRSCLLPPAARRRRGQ